MSSEWSKASKRTFQRNALNRTTSDDSYELVWERIRELASAGSGFNKLFLIERTPSEGQQV